MTPLLQVAYDGLEVLYLPHLDGGGRTFGQDVVRFVRAEIGPVGHALEWCAGPGFIGLALLSAGLCDRLTLADVNAEAVRVARETVRRNNLADRVTVVESYCLDNVPPDPFDLVVANPPHTPGGRLYPRWGPEILYVDQDWAAHRRFYATVRDRLAPGGSVLIQENSRFTRADDFAGMIEDAGLTLVGAPPSVGRYYFVWSRNEAPAC